MDNAFWTELTAIFRKEFDDDSILLTEGTTAKDLKGWDSVMHVILVAACEKKFRVRLTASEIQKLNTVGQLAALIQNKRT